MAVYLSNAGRYDAGPTPAGPLRRNQTQSPTATHRTRNGDNNQTPSPAAPRLGADHCNDYDNLIARARWRTRRHTMTFTHDAQVDAPRR